MPQNILDYGLKAKSSMEWWQEVNRQVANLEWWQISLILVAIIFISILISLSICYVIICFVYKSRVTLFFLFYVMFSKKHKPFASSNLVRHSIDTTIASPEVNELAKFPIPELLVKIEHNLKILTDFSGDAQLPLQSDVQDADRYSANKLSVNQREQFSNHRLQQLENWIHLVKKGDSVSLTELRNQLGRTQKALADKVGVSEYQLQCWEQGEQQPSGKLHAFWKLRLYDYIEKEISILLGTNNTELASHFGEILWRLNYLCDEA